MVYKIADFLFQIDSLPESVKKFCRGYEADNFAAVDAKIEVVKGDVEYEQRAAESFNMMDADYDDCFGLAFYRKICAEVLQRDAFMMHGAVIEYEGKGYLFTAKSGTGKTTHIRLWKKLFGEDKVYAYGTPWCGKEGYNTNTRVPLAGICFLERNEENSIKKISDTEALPRLLSQIMVHDSADLARQLELVDALFERVPTYLLKCSIDIEAARVAYLGMNK